MKKRFRLLGVAPLVFATLCQFGFGNSAAADSPQAADLAQGRTHPLYLVFSSRVGSSGPIHDRDIQGLTDLARGNADDWGRVTPDLQKSLWAIEADFVDRFDLEAKMSFQAIIAELGAKQTSPILMPRNDVPYLHRNLWIPRGESLRRALLQVETTEEVRKQFPFAEFLSTPTLPAEVDIVVIGGGLTGATAGFYLVEEMRRRGLKVVILDSDLSQAASLRNGANIESLPEGFLVDYQGIIAERAKYYQLTHPGATAEAAIAEGHRQARVILQYGLDNFSALHKVVKDTKMDAIFNPAGWFRIAETSQEESVLREECEFAKSRGVDFEFWSVQKIHELLGLTVKYGARLAKQSGNYHPGRYVSQLLTYLIAEGVGLYTHTPVSEIESRGAFEHWVKTSRGTIRAKSVIVATNGFSKFVPELSVIQPFRSHVADYNHVEDPSHGKPIGTSTITAKQGDLYGQLRVETLYQNRQGTYRAGWHIGGGIDSPIDDPLRNARDPKVAALIQKQAELQNPSIKNQPPTTVSTGVMGFTPDRTWMLGWIREGVAFGGAYNGYGGSAAPATGRNLAELVLHHFGFRDEAPQIDPMFDPLRFRSGAAVDPMGKPFTNDNLCAWALVGKVRKALESSERGKRK